MVILIGEGNTYVANFDASEKQIIISKMVDLDVELSSIKSVYNVTRGASMTNFPVCYPTNVSISTVDGLPEYTITFNTVPALSADTDEINILLYK